MNIRSWLATILLTPYSNSQLCKQPFGSRGSHSNSQKFYFFLLLVIKKLQLQQAAVSPHQLAVCPPPQDTYTTAAVTCIRLSKTQTHCYRLRQHSVGALVMLATLHWCLMAEHHQRSIQLGFPPQFHSSPQRVSSQAPTQSSTNTCFALLSSWNQP